VSPGTKAAHTPAERALNRELTGLADDVPMSTPELLADAAALLPELTRLRRELHAEPEVGLELPLTQRKVLGALAGLPLEVTLGKQLSSVVAVLRGERPGPTVLLRGDMDALPLEEATGLDFASRFPGRMHACGHDLHTTMLAGAARLLCDRRDELAGNVIFMFQPGEEHDAGGRLMIEEGVLDAAGDRPVAAYVLHTLSGQLPTGRFGTRAGPLTANSDELHVTVAGVGGHGSVPVLARDPVAAASAMVTALQVYISRSVNIFDPVVISVCSFHAGTAVNIIPGEALFSGTIRSFSKESRRKVLAGIREVLGGVAQAHGVRAEISFREGYPAVVNDPRETSVAASVVRELFGGDRLALFPTPSPAAEDFSFILAEVPGAYVFLGACPDECNALTAPFNHAPGAIFADGVLSDGAAFLTGIALRRLREEPR
jgi:hippurate hydrolase